MMAHNEQRPDDPESPASRRGFLTASVGIVGAGMAATVLGPVAVFLGHPLDHETTSGSDAFLPVGPVSQFLGSTPVKVDLYSDQVDAWNRVSHVKVGSAWVLRRDNELVAYSAVCPHLGCGIDYAAQHGKFYCACHKSYFGLDGSLEEGPSPRGMDPLDIMAQDRLVSIRYQRFRQGVANREPLA